ncbi:MAG: hypothetical protein ABI169_06470 [Chitinophagaceae bacterium]
MPRRIFSLFSFVSIFKYLIHTSLFTAACAVAMCMGAERLMLGHLPPFLSPLHYLIIGSTLVEYNVHHLFNVKQPLNHRFANWPHWLMTAVGAVLCVLTFPWHQPKVLLAFGVLGLLSFAYSTPLLPFKYKKRLKDYGLIKIHLLTLVWVLVTTWLPALYWKQPIGHYWVEMVLRFSFIFPLCIAFDIRDVKADRSIDIYTLPNTIGVANAYRACDVTLFAFLVLGTIQSVRKDNPMVFWWCFITAVFAAFSIHLSRKWPHPYAYLFLVDGAMLVYGVLQCVL